MVKKIIVFFLLISSTIFSQEIINKNGFPILPQKGDWSIGTDAGSMISYVGNIFSGDYNPVDISFHQGTFIYVKRMIEDNVANRYKMGAFFNSISEELEFGIGYGYEKRKGKTRLQGFYGYEGFVGMNYIDEDEEKDFITSISTSIFIGCEYFIASKVAIGAEYTYGPILSVSDQINFLLEGGTGTIRMNFYF